MAERHGREGESWGGARPSFTSEETACELRKRAGREQSGLFFLHCRPSERKTASFPYLQQSVCSVLWGALEKKEKHVFCLFYDGV